MKLIALRAILKQPEEYTGWLYMKPGVWTLDTMGFFYDADLDLPPANEAAVRAQFEADGWVITLSNEDIEDAIDNTCAQIEQPSEAELLEAVRYFYDHDAFIEWPD